MDEGDRAKAWQEQQIEDALATHRRRQGSGGQDQLTQGHPATSLVDCASCGAEIPLARRRVVPGCRTCIDCQRDMEKGRGK